MPVMTYSVLSHDAWGSANVGSFTSLEQAREVFEALQKDRWFLADGTVRGLSIVETSSGSGALTAAARTVESFSFPQA
jgi:hypothetical protein